MNPETGATQMTDENQARQAMEQLKSFLKPYWKKGMFILFLTIFSISADISLIHILKRVLDDAVTPKKVELLVIFCIVYLLVVLTRTFFEYALRLVFHGTAEQILMDMRQRMFEKMMHQSQSFFRNRDVGEIASRILNDVEAMHRFLSISLLSPISNGIFIVGMTIYLFVISWKLALIVLIILPLYALIQRPLMTRIRYTEIAQRENIDEVSSEIVESLSAVEEIQSNAAERYQIKRFTDRLDLLRIAGFRRNMSDTTIRIVSGMGTGLTQLLVLAFGGYLALNGYVQAGVLVAFMVAVTQLLAPVEDVTNLYGQFIGARVLAERIAEYLLAEPTVQEKPDAPALPAVQGQITLEKISFAYDGDKKILDDVSLTIEQGQMIAIAGPSGSGKSTILHLIRRFYDPDAGRVLLDGLDIKEYSLLSLRNQIATVNQRPSLFNTSIRDNIRYAKIGATDEEVEEAAKTANLYEEIMKLPGGFEFIVGPDGSRLSGGQRQRVAIARAILRDAPILLLDEATSALDAESQAVVQKALDKLLQRTPKKTCIVIAHRLSTIKAADNIIVLSDGQIQESGTHGDLLQKNGLYSKLHNHDFIE
jgi:ABC-type multidrug transport system fused ATPase/permease subunit